MRIGLFQLFLSALLLTPSFASAGKPVRVLVMETPSSTKTVKACQILDDVLVSEVANAAPSGFSVTSSQEVALMMNQAAQRQIMGCADEDCLVNFADAVNADILVMPSLRRVSNEYMISVKSVAAKEGGVIGRETVYTRANYKSIIEAGKKLADVVNGHLNWGGAQAGMHYENAQTFQWTAVASEGAGGTKQAGLKSSAASVQQPKQRLVIVTRETIDGKPNALSPAGNALTRALKKQGYKIVAQDIAKRLRKQNTVALMMDGELPEEVSSLDADLLLVGVADASYVGSMMADVETYTTTMEVKTVRLDTAEVADAFSTTVSHGFFSKVEAGRGALKKAGGEAGKHFEETLLALQNAPKSMEILVHGVPDRRSGSEVKNRLKQLPGIKDVVVRQSSKKVTKIEFVSEMDSEDLADSLDDDLTIPLEILQSSRNALLARYDGSKGLKLGLLLMSPVGKLSRQDTWIKMALPDLLQAELANIDYLEVANEEEGPIAISGNKVTSASVKKSAKSYDEVPLALSTSVKPVKNSLLVNLHVHDAQTGKTVYRTKAVTSPENLSAAAEKLGQDIRKNLLKKLAKKTLKRAPKSTQKLIVASNMPSKQPEPLVTRLSISSIDLQDLFPAQASHYRDNAAGFVTIRHPDKSAPLAKDVRIQIFIPKVMTYPSEVTIAQLKPGEEKKIPVHLILDPEKFLLLEDNTPAQAEVAIEYLISDGRQADRRTASLMVFGKNALDWESPESMGAFVTPQEISVKKLARQALKARSDETLPETVQNAIATWHVLKQQNFSYVKDSAMPTRERVLDHVQYPRETLDQRAGDCDDLSALYASMLEAVGVETALVLTPGHILVAFSPGPLRQTIHQVTYNSDRYLEAEGRVWIPIETTMVGQSFEAAWKKGAQLAIVDNAPSKVDVIPMRNAWQVYPPLSLPKNEVKIAVNAKTLKTDLADQLKTIQEARTASLDKQIAALRKKAKGKRNLEEKNRLASLLALTGKYSDAESVLKKALKGKKRPEFQVSLGNTKVLQGQTKEAVNAYRDAIEQYLESGEEKNVAAGEVYNNMAIAYLVSGDQKAAEKAFVQAAELGAPSLMASLAGKTMQVEGRGSNAAEAKPDTVLDQSLKAALENAMKKRADRRKAKRRLQGGQSNARLTDLSRFKDPLPSGGRRGDDANSKKRVVDLLLWHHIMG